MEDDFVAWGNEKGLTGRNWFTDTMAMLTTASRSWPDQWPALSVSHRASRKIEKVHYKNGMGRIGYAQEGSNRAYSQRIIDELTLAAAKAPAPVFSIFALILATGMRAEDGHAVLFDCLKQDENDDDFMLLTFWQNKVRKWNDKPLHKRNSAHIEIINLIKTQREKLMDRYGKPTKYLFPVFNGTHESFLAPSYSMNEIKRQCLHHGILADDGSPLSFSWHPLRHTKGTSLAKEGHDILSIMMELGHTSPDMATVYINNRLELKKKALLEHGSGRFYTIEGRVDERVSNLIARKDQVAATRVCGGACAMPTQIGDWCEHANACYTCKHYRADAKDVDFFKAEQISIIQLIEEQQGEAKSLDEHGRVRMSEITSRRLNKNKEVYRSLGTIIAAIEGSGSYAGAEHKVKQIPLEIDE
jgi:integrase